MSGNATWPGWLALAARINPTRAETWTGWSPSPLAAKIRSERASSSSAATRGAVSD
jgi:hypothetical protein